MLREVVRRLAAGAPELSTTAKTELVEIMTDYTGRARMPFLLEWGADALAAELATSDK